MILIGQFDSPFVRRVGIALELYGFSYEHRPWSVFGDADKLRSLNPLTRVPTLVLDDGFVLIESHAMIDYLDSLVPVEQRLFPAAEPARRQALKVAALGTGLAEKAVSLFYEKALHREISEVWAGRCRTQLEGALHTLEQDRSTRSTDYWHGDAIDHADIAVAAALRFVGEAHPGLLDFARYPALTAHCSRLEALPVFQRISQPFIPPA